MSPDGSSAAADLRGVPAVSAVLAALLLSAGCGLTPPEREEARVLVESDGSDAPVQVVTSTVFNVAGSQGPTDPPGSSVELLAADTAVQALPFERTFDIRSTRRIFVRAQTPEAATDTPSVAVSVRVFVDGEQRNSVQGDLAEQPVQTVFLSGN